MKIFLLGVLITTFSAGSFAQTKKFTGMFFSIAYPADFKVKNCPVPD